VIRPVPGKPDRYQPRSVSRRPRRACCFVCVSEVDLDCAEVGRHCMAPLHHGGAAKPRSRRHVVGMDRDWWMYLYRFETHRTASDLV